MHLESLFINYIEAYAQKDLQKIATLFADDIRLRDWKISVSGKENAVAETRKNFASANTINIDILSTQCSEDSIAGELKITVDGEKALYVVDVVTFTTAGKIASIRAYLGRRD